MDCWRHEYKYICDNITLQLIERRIQVIMKSDSFATTAGMYNVRSLYFDDYLRRCYFDNEDGIDPRSKWRIRIYNCSDNRITLEKKIKCKGMTQKKTCQINRELLCDILTNTHLYNHLGKNPLLDDFIIESHERYLRPVLLGEYIRKPYVCDLGNVRVTIDCNISASNQFERMFDRDIPKIQVLKTGYSILEVKWDDFLPDMIYQLIDSKYLVQSTFSKFYLGCRALEGSLF